MENLYLIAGLGNPGAEYARTRHNAGFLLVDRLAGSWKASPWALDKKFNGLVARAGFAGQTLFLCKPQTFMNASGESIGRLAEYHRVPPARLLVVVDDADLPFGQIRMRPGGSSGGHHGLESVERHLGTRDYARLRIGIGRRADGVREITNHVLGHFGPDEAKLLEKVLDRAAQQAECWLSHGPQKAMNQFNGTVDGPENKKETE